MTAGLPLIKLGILNSSAVISFTDRLDSPNDPLPAAEVRRIYTLDNGRAEGYLLKQQQLIHRHEDRSRSKLHHAGLFAVSPVTIGDIGCAAAVYG